MGKYFTISGYCSTTKRPIGFQCENRGGDYVALASFSASASAGGDDSNSDVNAKIYAGDGFKCKYCGNDSLVVCYCGTVICVKHEATSVTCPKCGKSFNLRLVSIDELNKENLKGDKQ